MSRQYLNEVIGMIDNLPEGTETDTLNFIYCFDEGSDEGANVGVYAQTLEDVIACIGAIAAFALEQAEADEEAAREFAQLLSDYVLAEYIGPPTENDGE